MKKIYQILSSPYLILVYFILLELAFTYPVVFHLKTYLIAEGDFADSYQHIWGFWWFKYALENLHTNPFFTHFLHWPSGVSLIFQTWCFPYCLVALLLQPLFGEIANFNLLMIFSVAFTGFTTYLLVLYLTRNKLASFFAGFLMISSAYLAAHSQGHLQSTAFEFVPLFILYFLKMKNRETDWKLATLFLVLASFTDWYNLFYLVIFIVIWLGYERLAQRGPFEKNFRKDFSRFAFFSLLFILPYLGPLAYTALTNKMVVEHEARTFSTDFLAFFIPNHPARFLAFFFKKIYQNWTGSWESVGYLGYSSLFLSIYAAVKIRGKILFWLLAAALFALFSMGPFFHFNGAVTGFPLPYRLFEKLFPAIANLMGVPTRMMVMTYLALAVLSGFGLKELLQKKTKIATILAILFILIAVGEKWPKTPVTQVYTPPFYSVLAKDPRDFAIIDTSNPFQAKILYYQTIHHKPIIGGYSSRRTVANEEFLHQTPTISDILYLSSQNSDPKKAFETLKKYKVKYVLAQVGPQNVARNDLLSKTYGLPIVYQDYWMIVYQVY